MADMSKYFGVLTSLNQLFDNMIALEAKKLDAISRNEIDRIEQYMKDEQAFTMQLRGIDNKRDVILKEMGFPGYTMKQMLDVADGDNKQRIRDESVRLEKKVEDLKNAIASAKKYIELHLHGIEGLLAGITDENISSHEYSNTGQSSDANDKPISFKSRKV